jgi:hypothetical protein
MSKQPQTPQPMSFAILRNTHEVFRKSIELMSASLDTGALDEFRQEWRNFQRCRQTHLAMEEDAVFSLLDDVGDGAITQAGLGLEHIDDLANAELVNRALTVEDVAFAFNTWKVHQLNHLAHEERIMGPLTMKTAATPVARGQVVHDTLLPPAIEHGDFDWYLEFVIKRLTSYGTSNQPPDVAVRVFAWGLQYAANAGQWERWKLIIQNNTSDEIWSGMVEDFQINGDGKIAG